MTEFKPQDSICPNPIVPANPMANAVPLPLTTHTIEHDGFTGTVIGHYVTREGKHGVVLQQIGTRVVHVYGEKWLSPPKAPVAIHIVPGMPEDRV